MHIIVHYGLYLQTAHCCHHCHRSIGLQLVVEIRRVPQSPRKLPRWLMEIGASSGFPWKQDIPNRRGGAHLSVVVDLRFLLDVGVELRDVRHVAVWLLAAGVAITVWGEDDMRLYMITWITLNTKYSQISLWTSCGVLLFTQSVKCHHFCIFTRIKKTSHHIFALKLTF